MSYQFVSELITPEKAESWLQTMIENRPIKKQNLRFLTSQIREGKWIDTGVPIVFVGENLIDGQHRLRAVLEAKKSIYNAVVRHPKDKQNVFTVIDTGAKRSAADVLHIAGYASSKLLAETLKSLSIWRFLQSEATRNQSEHIMQSRMFNIIRQPDRVLLLDNATLLQLPNMFMNVEDSVRFAGNKQRRRTSKIDPLSRSKWAFLHYVFNSIDPSFAQEFLDSLHSGTGVGFATSTSPLAQLRDTLITRKQIKLQTPQAYGSISDSVTIILHAFTAWNAMRGLGTYKASKLNESSPIPIPR